MEDLKENEAVSKALRNWALSQSIDASELLYATLRLIAEQFIARQAVDRSSADQFILSLEKMRVFAGDIFVEFVKGMLVDRIEGLGKKK